MPDALLGFLPPLPGGVLQFADAFLGPAQVLAQAAGYGLLVVVAVVLLGVVQVMVVAVVGVLAAVVMPGVGVVVVVVSAVAHDGRLLSSLLRMVIGGRLISGRTRRQ